MLKLLTSQQMRAADSHTIATKPIASVDLMEAASLAFVDVFAGVFPDKGCPVAVYCGTGNNGGDGLAIARLLKSRGYQSVKVTVARFSSKTTPDFEINYRRLVDEGIEVKELKGASDFAEENAGVIVDALLGSGLNKPLGGEWKKLAMCLNECSCPVVSVDVPTGFNTEGPVGKDDVAVFADLTITFQRPKINFLLPEAADFMGSFTVVNIGLDEDFIQGTEGPYFFLTGSDVKNILKPRLPFSHKGTFGHALLVAGAPETMGAALLCASGCLHAGAGLTSLCIPKEGLTALNTTHPEVMAVIRSGGELPDVKWDKYQSVAIGPGLGAGADSLALLKEVLRKFKKPLVIDADALNLLSRNYELMQMVPERSIFTPHVKEFDRLFGQHDNWWQRLETGIDRAVTLGCIIVLKNRYTIIFTPDGKCLFNPTGTPAMATGGMGDTLTGMLASFLAQGYSPADAAILAVFLHGAAGEEAGGYLVTPTQLTGTLPQVMLKYQG